MTIVSTAVGIALIAIVVHDIFTVLFRAGAQSRLSGAIPRAIWSLFRRAGNEHRDLLALAGPFALAAVICFWAMTLVLGWALIYLPHYPQEYVIAEGTSPHSALVGALHTSLTMVTTLGSANVVPKPAWLQLLSPFEALIGFGMLTAAVSWLLQVYPVLSRRRALAYEIHLLADTERRLDLHVAQIEVSVAAELYAELTSRLIGVERDLAKFPITYYFAETEPRYALAAAMPVLTEIAERGTAAENPDSVRLRAEMLYEAVEDFASIVVERFGLDRRHDVTDAIKAFAHDHRHEADGTTT
ncbi:MAG TPA: ion channel [Solirubrobacteraceae bacterium]|nr:ion channel [Solirubrobacteraceae bacterium]